MDVFLICKCILGKTIASTELNLGKKVESLKSTLEYQILDALSESLETKQKTILYQFVLYIHYLSPWHEGLLLTG